MNRESIDKKVALLRWFSNLEDEMVIDELVEIMNREKIIEQEMQGPGRSSYQK